MSFSSFTRTRVTLQADYSQFPSPTCHIRDLSLIHCSFWAAFATLGLLVNKHLIKWCCKGVRYFSTCATINRWELGKGIVHDGGKTCRASLLFVWETRWKTYAYAAWMAETHLTLLDPPQSPLLFFTASSHTQLSHPTSRTGLPCLCPHTHTHTYTHTHTRTRTHAHLLRLIPVLHGACLSHQHTNETRGGTNRAHKHSQAAWQVVWSKADAYTHTCMHPRCAVCLLCLSLLSFLSPLRRAALTFCTNLHLANHPPPHPSQPLLQQPSSIYSKKDVCSRVKKWMWQYSWGRNNGESPRAEQC